MRAVLSGGGTGGHIYPAVSIGQALKEQVEDAQILFIGSSHGPEGEIAKKYGLQFVAVPSAPLSRSLSARNLSALSKLFLGLFRARKILKDFRPDVVIGTGGYTCAAVLLAQSSRRGKLVIHEQNVVPGKTNKHLSRLADLVCVSFESSAKLMNPGSKTKVVCTGMPVRREFSNLPDKRTARRSLQLQDDLFTVLLVGGSQGAKKLNDTALQMWQMIDDANTQFLHQAGTRNVRQVLDEAEQRGLPARYRIESYLDMPLALACADVVVSRSGASTLAEISAAGRPSVLVPYPFAFADHQRLNAEAFAENGAAKLVIESCLSAEVLADIITKMRSQTEVLEEMSKRAKQVFAQNAAQLIVHESLCLIGEDSRANNKE